MIIKQFSKKVITLSVCGLLVGCGGKTYAPVVNAWHQSSAASSQYRVRSGDTLYSIAWQFNLDYRSIAKANDLSSPYHIQVGQRLRMTTASPYERANVRKSVTSGVGSAKTPRHKSRSKVVKQPKTVNYSGRWQWPAKGRLAAKYSAASGGNKGINISGRLGEPVRAAASGAVVYSGSGIRGYGNLIIVKHNSSFLSAYAYNLRNLVKVGMRVHRGQTIATMGRNAGGKVMLHFEIRRNGRPVNPLTYLR